MYYLLTLVLIASLVAGCGHAQAVVDTSTPSIEFSPQPTTTAPQSTPTPWAQPTSTPHPTASPTPTAPTVGLQQTFAEAYVVRVDQPKQCTSGVLLGKDGLILTNFQISQGARSLVATTAAGHTAPLKLLAYNRMLDLALLQTASPLPEPEPLVWTARTATGSPVFVLGFPFPRSEERRVGKECRSRWSPYH